MAPGPSDATPVFEAQKRAAPELKAVADFLRGKNGPKVRTGILNGKRVDYFKGKTAIRTLTGPAYQKVKKAPVVKDEEEAKALLGRVLPHAFFLRVDRPATDPPTPTGQPKPVQLAPQQSVAEDAYYAWFYDGSPLYTILGGVAMVIIMLTGVMFPLWPIKLRIGVWYLSIGVLGLVGALIALAIVRLILWCVTVVSMKRAIWIFPNLFEDVGFFESFVPTWAYDEPKKKKKRVHGKREKSTKGTSAPSAAGGEVETAAAATAATDDIPSATTSVTPAQTNGDLRHRQAATVEEIEDEGI